MRTCIRELSDGVRQWTERIELASELLPEKISVDSFHMDYRFESRRSRKPTVTVDRI